MYIPKTITIFIFLYLFLLYILYSKYIFIYFLGLDDIKMKSTIFFLFCYILLSDFKYSYTSLSAYVASSYERRSIEYISNK